MTTTMSKATSARRKTNENRSCSTYYYMTGVAKHNDTNNAYVFKAVMFADTH